MMNAKYNPMTSDQKQDMKHALTICIRDVKGTQYVGKGYKSEFQCPDCGRKTWQHLSFLGMRNVVCDGQKFTKVSKERIALDAQG